MPDRLPEQLASSWNAPSDPIGRILAAHGVAPDREAFPRSGPGCRSALAASAAVASEIIWFRSYCLPIDDLPVFAIREWFFRSVLDAVDRSTPV